MIPDPSLELRDLRLVRAIFSAGGVTKAAKLLGMTQSAASHRLRNLEERLGLEVFEREGRGVRATPAGDRLLLLSHEVLESVAEAEEEIKLAGSERITELRLSTQCYTAYHWLPQAMHAFARLHPHVRLKIVPEATPDPRAALSRGELDLALCIGRSDDPRYCQRHLFSDEIVLVVPPEHALASCQRVEWEQLQEEQMILYDLASNVRERMRRAVFPDGGDFPGVTLLPLTEAIVEMVKAGMGVSVLANWSVEREVKRGELVAVSLPRKSTKRKWVGTYARDSQLSEPIRTLLSILVKNGGPERGLSC